MAQIEKPDWRIWNHVKIDLNSEVNTSFEFLTKSIINIVRIKRYEIS